jgi:hypothetical protein
MNQFTHSAECAHDIHSACGWDDCASQCHADEQERLTLLRQLRHERDPQLSPRELHLELGCPRAFRDVPRRTR